MHSCGSLVAEFLACGNGSHLGWPQFSLCLSNTAVPPGSDPHQCQHRRFPHVPPAPLWLSMGPRMQLLTAAGFTSTVRDPDAPSSAVAATILKKRGEREARLAASTRALVVSWALALTCFAGHLLHCWPGIFYAPAAVRFLASPALHAALSVATLLGPGRGILVDGTVALARGRPDMNSLVTLGAVSALGVSAAAAALPALGWRTFFEEPAMLLSVVLLGRTLEERAKLQVCGCEAGCACYACSSCIWIPGHAALQEYGCTARFMVVACAMLHAFGHTLTCPVCSGPARPVRIALAAALSGSTWTVPL